MHSEYRIWLDIEANIYAVVSLEDHAWALQRRWQITWDRHKRKAYATRSTRLAGNRRVKLYLHKEILSRSGKVQPCEKHTMGDHGDGDSLNCRRDNLEWATPSQNRRTARPPQRPPRFDVKSRMPGVKTHLSDDQVKLGVKMLLVRPDGSCEIASRLLSG